MASCFCQCSVGEKEHMGCRKFYLTIDSAENLPNVRKVSRTRAYAKIYIRSSGGKPKHQTDVDKNNGLNPAWKESIEITEWGELYHGMPVTIKLYTKRTMGDRYICEVSKTKEELLEGLSENDSASLSLPIMRGSANAQGNLRIGYGFKKRSDIFKSHFKKEGGGSLASFTKDVVKAAQAICTCVLPFLP